MARLPLITTLATVAALGATACDTVTRCAPPSSNPMPGIVDAGPDARPIVLGFADLHTHPGIEQSFGGRLMWGHTCEGDAPVDPEVLPLPPPCPVETHAGHTGSPIERTAHGLLLPLLNDQDGYVHAPIVSGEEPLSGWPNARDVIHQSMEVSSIRRAYEGGLRFLFASVTDNQLLAQLLQGPVNPSLVTARASYDEASALAQLEAIEDLVASQSSWMTIVRSPAEAFTAISAGRLAVVLSLEMDALPLDATRRMIRERGVRHVLPVHLVDNSVGGTAVTGDIFNSASAYMSELWGPRWSYIRVNEDEGVQMRLRRPVYGATQHPFPVFGDLDEIGLSWYERLGYADTCFCHGPFTTQFAVREDGHTNERALVDASFVGELLRGVSDGHGGRIPVMVDVSHMSWRTADAVRSIAAELSAPLMASHGDVAFDGEVAESERSLSPALARYVAESGGVVGLGTSFIGPDHVLRQSEAHPIATLTSARTSAAASPLCAVDGDLTSDCVRTVPLPRATFASGDAVSSIDTEITNEGWCTAGAEPVYVTVRIADPGASCATSNMTVLRAPLVHEGNRCIARVVPDETPRVRTEDAASCTWDPTLGTVEVERICQVTLETVDEACAHDGRDGPLGSSLATVTARGATDILLAENRATGRLTSKLPTLDVFRRGASPTELAGLPIVSVGVHLADGLEGPSLLSPGYELCATLRRREGDACVRFDVIAGRTLPGIRGGCVDGISINHRGAISENGAIVRGLVSLPPSTVPEDLCGVDFTLVGDATEITVDVTRIELSLLGDPMEGWAARYGRVLATYFDGEAGRIAFGTDFNGLATQLAITTTSEDIVQNGVDGWQTPPLERMRAGTVPLRLEDRGLATYGMLADLVARVRSTPGGQGVSDSLLYSAEYTLRYWERAVRASEMTP